MNAKLAEIPVGGMGIRDAVEMMTRLSGIGYEANLKSKNGKIVIQLHKQHS
jgi:hypothetical protein